MIPWLCKVSLNSKKHQSWKVVLVSIQIAINVMQKESSEEGLFIHKPTYPKSAKVFTWELRKRESD